MPTTANFMSKLSIGKAEDLATTVLLAADKDTSFSASYECQNVVT
jgi:phosphopantothenoylcysteine synthetase/decarboxylase